MGALQRCLLGVILETNFLILITHSVCMFQVLQVYLFVKSMKYL